MNKKEAWNKFKNSGKVEDYLEYVKTICGRLKNGLLKIILTDLITILCFN